MIIDFIKKQNMNPEDRRAIAGIIKEGFWGKIGNYFRNVNCDESIKIIEEAITFDKGFYFKENGIVLGAALLGTSKTSYINFNRQARKSMGFWNGFIMQLGYGLLKPKRNDGLKLEMLAVCPEARGKGIGKIMLDYLVDLAQEEGFKRITLEVIDSNEKAKKLYEKKGYKAVKYINTAIFTRNIGFRGSFKMQKDLSLDKI
jgi:ribosomal protein S18 acetylase RimI-like enzyme